MRLFLPTLLLLLFSPLVGANTQRTMCKVKKRGDQGILVARPPDSNTTILPSSTQVLGDVSSTIQSRQTAEPTATLQATTPDPLPPFDYGNTKVRGVNLGGWFMMEPWITPSMFDDTNNDGIVDEFTFGLYQDKSTALGRLENHWATWYTEQDFIDIAAAGLNHVRLPVPYWAVPLDQDTGPYITGAWPYILQALDWAASHNIYVILDLHGAPGSQNGFDNSGQRTANPSWALDQTYLNHTLDVLEAVARQIGNRVSVIELVNELAGFRGLEWAEGARVFWKEGYERVRSAVGDGVKIMIGDAFLGLASWDGYMKAPEYQGVLMDLHVYQVFSTQELQRSWDDHISFMCNRANEFTTYASQNLWLIMGEWSNAITDCAPYLNGRGVGSRWDGTYPSSPYLGSCQGMSGDAATFSEEYKVFLRRYWEAQVHVAEKVEGWIYWTWKAERADDWSYLKGVQWGFIPRDAGERIYPDVCG